MGIIRRPENNASEER